MDAHIKLSLCGLLLAVAIGLSGCPVPRSRGPRPPREWAGAPEASSFRRGFLSAMGVGSPEESDPARVADRIARQELASAVAGYAERALTEFVDAGEGGLAADSPAVAAFREALVTEVAAALLRQSLQPEKWREEDGRLFVLYQVPAERVNACLVNQTRGLLPHQNPFGDEPTAVARALEEFLSGRARRQKLETARSRPAAEDASQDETLPVWMETGGHPDYSHERFLTVIGVGPGRMEARQNGRSELAAWLNGRLQKIIQSVRAAKEESVLAANLASVPHLFPRFSPDGLRGVRFPENWYDPVTDTGYVFTVLNRDTATVLLRQHALEEAEKAESFGSSGDNHEKAGNHAEALANYLEALLHAQQAVTLQCKALAAGTPSAADELRKLFPDPLAARAKERLRALLDRVEVRKVQGDRQVLPGDVAPREAFVVSVTVGEQGEPLADIPLRLVTDGQQPRPLGRATTNAGGVARWELDSPPPADGGAGTVVAQMALDEMAPAADMSGIDMPSVQFEYAFRSRENTRYVLAIQGEGAAAAAVRTALEGVLAAEGFQPVPQTLLLKRIRPAPPVSSPSDDELIERFSELAQELGPDKFLLIIGGQVETRLVEKTTTTQGELYIVYCSYDIRALDADLPAPLRRIAETKGNGQGASLESETDATERATTDAVRAVTRTIRAALRRRFGPAER